MFVPDWDLDRTLKGGNVPLADNAYRATENPTTEQTVRLLALYAKKQDRRFEVAASRLTAQLVLKHGLDIEAHDQLLGALAVLDGGADTGEVIQALKQLGVL